MMIDTYKILVMILLSRINNIDQPVKISIFMEVY
jgi:hypothetical protein